MIKTQSKWPVNTGLETLTKIELLETWNVYKQSFPFLKLKFSWVHGHFSDFMAPYLAKISFQINDLCSLHTCMCLKSVNYEILHYLILKLLKLTFVDFSPLFQFSEFLRNCWYSVKAKIPPKDTNPTNYFQALYNYHLSLRKNNILIWKINIS